MPKIVKSPMEAGYPPPPKSIAPTRIVDIKQLTEALRKPIIVPLGVDGIPYELELFRLTPAQEASVTEIMQELGPPPYKSVKGEGGKPVVNPKGEGFIMDYDYADPAYLRKQNQLRLQARAMRIYLGCPAVAAGNPGLTNREQIAQYVGGLWTEQVLELLSLTLMSGGLQVAERANFTIGSGSES